MTAVELNNVARAYPDGVVALRGVSLRIRQRELVGILGPSGSGKSTLLHLIGALDRPTAGSIHVGGYELAALSDREVSALRARSIGFVFQQFHLPAGVSALDAVADGLLYAGVGLPERRRRAATALRQVGMVHRLHHRSHELSGGERQRVAIARAVLGEPGLLLADEPTGNLDSRSGAEVLELVRELHAVGTTILVVTHDPEVAAACDRRVELRDGQVVADREAAR